MPRLTRGKSSSMSHCWDPLLHQTLESDNHVWKIKIYRFYFYGKESSRKSISMGNGCAQIHLECCNIFPCVYQSGFHFVWAHSLFDNFHLKLLFQPHCPRPFFFGKRDKNVVVMSNLVQYINSLLLCFTYALPLYKEATLLLHDPFF